MKNNIFECAARKILKEDFEADGNFYVYHGTDQSSTKGLLNTGFERSWTGSNGGNMYGKGVYTTFTFSRQGGNARGNYGGAIIKALVKSLKKFIIYKPEIAKKIYGEFNIENQLLHVFGKDFVERLKPVDSYYRDLEGRNVYVSYEKIINKKNSEQSSVCAHALCTYIFNCEPAAEFKVNGFIFCGNWDADVCFIKDFKNVYPVEVSYDLGRTFQPIKDKISDKFDRFARNDIDLHFQLGKINYKLFRELDKFPNYFINNYARVMKGGKYNFLWRGRSLKLGVISPVWFDTAPETFSDSGKAIVTINETPYIIFNDNGNFLVYTKNGDYICKLDDLKDYFDNAMNADEFDEEY